MDARRSAAARGLVLFADGLLVVAAMFAAYGAHGWLKPLIPQMREVPALPEYAAVAYLALPLWLGLVVALRLHHVSERPWSRWELLTGLARMHGLGLIALAVVLFVTQSTLNRTVIGMFVASSFALLYGERAILGAYTRHQHAAGRGAKRLLLVGDAGPAIARFVALASRAEYPPRIIGRLGASPGDGEPDEPTHLGDPTTLANVLGRNPVDEVLFFPPHDDPRRMRDALVGCSTIGVPASFVLDTGPLDGITPEVRREHETALLTFEVASKSPVAMGVKQVFDTLAAAILLMLLLPLLCAVSIVIVITMGRPVLFVQPRAGLRGRPFPLLKFRTMVNGAEAQKAQLSGRNEMTGPVFKLTDDPRVTRLGRFLRKSSIDELPQLFNVLTGAMSLVGPRPLPVSEQEGIQGWHRRRLSVKPGITCLWQIGGRSNLDFAQWMALDLRYVDEWSLGLDLKILLMTVPVVVIGRGAR